MNHRASRLAAAGHGYDPRVSLALAEHAVRVYVDPEWYLPACRSCGYRGAEILCAGGTQVGLAWAPGLLVITARGSSEWRDWYEDALALKVRWPELLEGRVHLGFKRQVARILPAFGRRVLELQAQLGEPNILLAGHSLGAADVPLLALYLQKLGLEPSAVYTFASPRPGDREFSAWYAEALPQTYRVVVVQDGEQDLVSRVPLSRWGWQHVGQPRIVVDGECYESEAAWEAVRQARPVGRLEQLRVVTRASRAVRAHFGAVLLSELGEVVRRAEAA